MGQYYLPIILDNETLKPVEAFNSHDYGNGLKLMEHSWLGNDFVAVVEAQLALDGPRRLVWAGDYADPEIGTESEEYPRGRNLYDISGGDEVDGVIVNAVPELVFECPAIYEYARRHRANYKKDPEPGQWGYPATVNAGPLPVKVTTKSHPFLFNVDKNEYVSKALVPKGGYGRIHPLPLLTCEGNGRGGGDFHTDEDWAHGDFSLIGKWARDRIAVVTHAPRGATRINFDLREDR